MPAAYEHILDYFKLVAAYPDYENVPQDFPPEENEEMKTEEPSAKFDEIREENKGTTNVKTEEAKEGITKGNGFITVSKQWVEERNDGTKTIKKDQEAGTVDALQAGAKQ